MGADKEVLPHSCKIEGVNKIKRPEEEELVVERRRRESEWTAAFSMSTRLVAHPKILTCWSTTTSPLTACTPGWSPIKRS